MTQAQYHLGAVCTPDGTCFRVWAPKAQKISVVSHGQDYPLAPEAEGYFAACVPEIRGQDLYQYRVNGQGVFPDPVSRFQPQGVHGPSQVVDANGFSWTDQEWQGLPRNQLVIYELHVGTFSPAGTFSGVAEKLPALKALGITAIELMPVADFPGERNWGYDGVALYAPARCYGTPDDLRRLVDQAHGLGLAVFIDVVYNHLGPDGNYTGVYSDDYFTDRHRSPWGAGLNLDGEHSQPVRRFFIENACMWIHDYHADGLRLDATHAISDDSPRHFLAELAEAARAAGSGRRVHLIAEDDRNLARIIQQTEAGGWGLDGLWADDWHHQMRRCLAGDTDGYYQDYSGRTADIVTTLMQGWFYTGQPSKFSGKPRGTRAEGITRQQLVYCLQNHDQIGNRALGGRLHHHIALPAFRAASGLLFFLPQIPLVFMGQEWAASSPFLYFTDHEAELGRLVTQGRREEFKKFQAFADPALREKIPDPQAEETFERSRLRWEERVHPEHALILKYYQRWLAWRLEHLAGDEALPIQAEALGEGGLGIARGPYVLLVQLKGSGMLEWNLGPGFSGKATVCLHSEDPQVTDTPMPPQVESAPGQGLRVRFQRPGAVLFQTA